MELIKINTNEKGEQVVSARELYNYLGVKERFSRFMERNFEYGFEKDVDYTPYQNVHPLNNQTLVDYALTLNCAKEIAMIQRSEKGKQVRQYFIECEKKLTKELTRLEILTMAIEAEKKVIELEEKVLLDAPKVEFANKVASSSDCIDIGTFAKLVSDELDLGRNKMFALLRNKKILMKNNQPYQKYVDNGTFKTVEQTFKTAYGEKISIKTLLTGQGQIKLLEKLRKLTK